MSSLCVSHALWKSSRGVNCTFKAPNCTGQKCFKKDLVSQRTTITIKIWRKIVEMCPPSVHIRLTHEQQAETSRSLLQVLTSCLNCSRLEGEVAAPSGKKVTHFWSWSPDGFFETSRRLARYEYHIVKKPELMVYRFLLVFWESRHVRRTPMPDADQPT